MMYFTEELVFEQRRKFNEKRRRLHLSRQKVADFLDVSISTINRWDGYKRFMPTYENIKKICFFVDSTDEDIVNSIYLK